MAQAVLTRSISADALKCAGGASIPERLRDIKPQKWAVDAATVERIHELGRDAVELHGNFAALSPVQAKATLRRFIAEANALLAVLTKYADRRRMKDAVLFRLSAMLNCFERSSTNMHLRNLVDVATYLAPLPTGEA